MTSKLLKRTNSLRNLELAWRVIQANGRFSQSEDVRAEIQRFGEDAYTRLRQMQFRLSRGKFKFPPAKGVPLQKLDGRGKPTGKIRPIVLAPLESRIAQRAVLNVLLDVPSLQPFIRTAYSFGGLRAQRDEVPDRLAPEGVLTAVPAAIEAALREIAAGSNFCATADIKGFFTKVPKLDALRIIDNAVNDTEFSAFVDQAVSLELSNMAALREKASEFPLETVGVAQGNSLSPLLGNLILADFDRQMNEGDCACLRYIDDFIIFAPSAKAARARLERAKRLLAGLGMELSPEKSSKGPEPVSCGFEFLGIEVCPGLIRPSRKAQRTLMAKVDAIIEDGKRALVQLRSDKRIERDMSFLSVMRRVDGTINGWGKHYWFCNDRALFHGLDERIWARVQGYLGCYSEVRAGLTADCRPVALGLTQLHSATREPFAYPKSNPRGV